MTIMQGFPPAAADQADLSNWRRRPHSAWALHHVREIVPTAEIANDPDDVWTLPEAEAPFDLSGLDAVMDAHSGDAVVVMLKGAVVYERYLNGNARRQPHILFSVSKSMLGLLAGVLAEEGVIDPAQPVTEILPEVKGTAYEGASLRDLLDMRVGVMFDEDYTATSGPIIDYRYAANWNPVPEGVESGDLRSFMAKLTERDGPHGGRFHYVSPNTDMLAWALERAAGVRYADLFSQKIFAPMGAETPGYITVDRIGGARGAGGMCFTARDLARIGQMMVEGGAPRGRRIIPESWIEDIETAGDPAAWNAGDFADRSDGREMHYRSKWYVERGDVLINGAGIHGQFLFVDRRRELSVAWFSSVDDASTGAFAPIVMNEVKKIRAAIDGMGS